MLWFVSSAEVVYFKLPPYFILRTISYVEFSLIFTLVKSYVRHLTWSGKHLSFSGLTFSFGIGFMEIFTLWIDLWPQTYLDDHQIYTSKLWHRCMGTQSGPRVGVKCNTVITPQICISIHWSKNMKLLKNSINQLAYKISKSYLSYTLAPPKFRYQFVMK